MATMMAAKKRVNKKKIQSLIDDFVGLRAASAGDDDVVGVRVGGGGAGGGEGAACVGSGREERGGGDGGDGAGYGAAVAAYVAQLEDPDDLMVFRIAQSHFRGAFFPEKTVGYARWLAQQR